MRNGLNDQDGALTAWEAAIASDPTNEIAARGLLEPARRMISHASRGATFRCPT